MNTQKKPQTRASRNRKKPWYKKVPWWLWAIPAILIPLSLHFASSTVRPPLPYTGVAREEIYDDEFQEVLDFINNFRNQKEYMEGCIRVTDGILRPTSHAQTNWNEQRAEHEGEESCANITLIIPSRQDRYTRLVMVQNSLNMVQVLKWAFSENGVPEVAPGAPGADQYNVLMNGLSLTLLTEIQQKILIPDGMRTMFWDGVSYPSDDILKWIEELSAAGRIYGANGGLSNYYR